MGTEIREFHRHVVESDEDGKVVREHPGSYLDTGRVAFTMARMMAERRALRGGHMLDTTGAGGREFFVTTRGRIVSTFRVVDCVIFQCRRGT